MQLNNGEIRGALDKYSAWLEKFGPCSQDHQDFYNSALGRRAKELYYKSKLLGTLAVMPMVFCEAFVPSARRLFYPRTRLPISDAHFAMGYALLFRAGKEERHYQQAVSYLEALKAARCPAYARSGWGYPFDWQTRRGVIKAWTPLITTTPYAYEAFQYLYQIDQKEEWHEIMHSIAEHCWQDYRDVNAGAGASSCTYTPDDGESVVNASSYRAGVLVQAQLDLKEEKYWPSIERNVNFVLQSQRPDGSWPYAMDGVRDFVDHFHTCFVLKGLIKVEKLTGHEGCRQAIERGVAYYLQNLFDDAGLPKPFARAPRLTVYKRELYDCAECINLGMLLKGRFPELDLAVRRTAQDIVQSWQLPSGAFRSRKLLIGFDNVPMHRWGGSEIFRSLALMAADAAGFEPLSKN